MLTGKGGKKTGGLYTKILIMFQDDKILVMQILLPFC